MAKLTPDLNHGLIPNYSVLMQYLNNCVPLQNLVEMFNNDRNTYSLFLACPVSVQTYHLTESDFGKKFGINTVINFHLRDKSIWNYVEPKNNVDVINVFTMDRSVDFSGKVDLVKSSCIELRYYNHIGISHSSKLTAATLLALGINTVVVTASEIKIGVRQ